MKAFKIICNNCKSDDTEILNGMYSAAVEGFRVVCNGCGNTIDHNPDHKDLPDPTNGNKFVINGKVYNTATSRVLAKGTENTLTTVYIMKTKNGAYYIVKSKPFNKIDAKHLSTEECKSILKELHATTAYGLEFGPLEEG